jgi:branched-chain amino acid transport system substrate-binding protein
LAAAIKQAGGTDGRKIREALENLNEKVEGVVTVYDKPFSATDHEAITDNIPVFGLVKGGRVVPAHPEDLEGDKVVRVKKKS